MTDLKKIGYFSRTHGLNGALVLQFEPKLNLSNHAKFLFLPINSIPTPFKIKETIRLNQQRAFILDGFPSKEAAGSLINKDVLAKTSDIITETSNPHEMLIGYSVVDENKEKIGIIQEIEEMPAQSMLHVEGKKMYLLPMVDAFILEIDHQNRTIIYQAPDGLLDL